MRKLPVLMLMIPFLVLGGCGGGEGGGPVEPQPLDTPEAYVGRGWERFEGGDSSGAQADFQAALDLDENHGPALAGYGWAMLVAAPSDISMQSALDSFDAALARGETASYVTAGRAAARLAPGTVERGFRRWGGGVAGRAGLHLPSTGPASRGSICCWSWPSPRRPAGMWNRPWPPPTPSSRAASTRASPPPGRWAASPIPAMPGPCWPTWRSFPKTMRGDP